VVLDAVESRGRAAVRLDSGNLIDFANLLPERTRSFQRTKTPTRRLPSDFVSGNRFTRRDESTRRITVVRR
jgi:hypothetical protein